jgi:hypothetical protein
MRTSMVTQSGLSERRLDLFAGIETTSSSAKTMIGLSYVESAELNFSKVRFRVSLLSNSAAPGSSCKIDLLDMQGVLSGGVPSAVVEIDTSTGTPPPGGPAVSPTAWSTYEADITAEFVGFAGAGNFMARLWSEDNATIVAAAKAALIFG